MRHPTKKQVQKVIDNFTKVLPIATKTEKVNGHSVDMGDGRIAKVENNVCGTPMCHGGWFALSCLKSLKKDLGYSYMTSYENGAEKMAEFLGFKNLTQLKIWAQENPKIWGNDNGDCMFLAEGAFNYKGKLTLAKIISHWKGVQKRLPK